MRRLFFGLAFLLGLAACEEQEPEAFREEINGVYFDNRGAGNMIVDSTSVTFVYTDENTMDVDVRVRILGYPTTYARPINIQVASSEAEAGTDYEVVAQPEVPANEAYFNYKVTLKRMPILKEKDLILELKLKANDYFSTPFDYRVQAGNDTTTVVNYRIIFTDRFTVPPVGWSNSWGGDFSQRKFEFMCKHLELNRADFNEEGKVSDAKWQAIALAMDSYVREQVALKSENKPYDPDAFDEKGNPFVFEKANDTQS